MRIELLDKKPEGVWIFSATQLKKFEAQPRAYYFHYILNQKQPQTQPQIEGSEGHKHHENYLLNKTPYPDTKMGNAAEKGKGYLPVPGHDKYVVESEIYFQLITDEGRVFHFVAKIDVLLLTELAKGINNIGVIDHKFVSSFDYNLTQEKLAEDLQAIIYTAACYALKPGVNVELGWLYHKKNKPYAVRATKLEHTIPDMLEKLQYVVSLCTEIEDTLLIHKDKEVKPSYLEIACKKNNCGLYRGCYYQGLCTDRSSSDIMTAQLINNGEKDMTTNLTGQGGLEAYLAQAAQQQQAPQQQVVATPPQPVVQQAPVQQAPVVQQPVVNIPQPQAQQPAPVAVLQQPAVQAPAQQVAPQQTAVPETPPQQAPVQQAPVAQEEKKETKKTRSKKLHVYYRCYPMKGKSCQIGHDLIKPFLEIVAKHYNVPYYRLAEYTNGEKFVAGLVANAIDNDDISGNVYLDESMSQIIVDAFIAAADSLTKGC